jgi:hypothetical protein
MAKKTIYDPGELDGVKKRLGHIDAGEAKRMQKILGGEIGEERSKSNVNEYHKRGNTASENSYGGIQKPKRTIELAPAVDDENNKSQNIPYNKFHRLEELSYIERIKMDECCGSSEFNIKTAWQVFVSRLFFFKTPLDRVSPWFVKVILNEYYEKLESLVTSTRLIFPRNNTDLSKCVRAASKTAFKILDTLRQWKLDTVISEISKVQARPRNVFVKDFETILLRIYTPIYILENLDIEKDIKAAFSVLYEIASKENFREEKMMKNKIAEALSSYSYVRNELRRLLYPLLMKTIASYYQDYELFFYENSETYKEFLGLNESDQIIPELTVNKIDDQTVKNSEPEYKSAEAVEDSLSGVDGENSKDSTQEMAAAEAKAIDRSMKILEVLFPKAPWDKMDSFPDFYPYFADVLEIKKNGELIAPEDPVQIVLVLSQVLEEMLYGFRYIDFKISLSDGDFLSSILDKWHDAIMSGFEKNYIPRIAEYAHFFEHSGQNRASTYAMNIAADIHWIRRYYFLPNYETLPPTPPSFIKKDVIALYPIVHSLRKDLTACASAIEAANSTGGSAIGADVVGIGNPWEAYKFEVENPLSKRLNMLLGKNQRNNASLIFFTLAVLTVLDNYLCGKNSIAYTANNQILFRHAEYDELKPVLWVEKQSGTFDIFKKSIDELKKKTSCASPPRVAQFCSQIYVQFLRRDIRPHCE